MKIRTVLHYLALFVGLTASCALAQDVAPVGPFHTVHMIRIDKQQAGAERAMLAAIAALNQAIVKAGCAECTYHLWRVEGEQQGTFNYLQISYWPGREVYDKIHNSPGYEAASKTWLLLRSAVTLELYNRFVEIKPEQ